MTYTKYTKEININEALSIDNEYCNQCTSIRKKSLFKRRIKLLVGYPINTKFG